MKRTRALRLRLLATMLAAVPVFASGQSVNTTNVVQAESRWADADGHTLMQAVRERDRHYPYTYEELALILVDKDDRHRTRRIRRFTRAQADGSGDLLILFDLPETVGGVALLMRRETNGSTRTSIYLPALGPELVETDANALRSSILGTDFSVEDLVGERLDDYRFVRRPDESLGDTDYYRIDAHALEPGMDGDPPLYRHYVVKDSLTIIRTDALDPAGRLLKRQTRHDFQRVGADLLRPNLLMMKDMTTRHRSLLRIERRVFSRDYVPDEVFSAAWLRQNYPPADSAR